MKTCLVRWPTAVWRAIEKARLRTPSIFELIRKTGDISEHDMYNTFNMGVGMAVVVTRPNMRTKR